MRLEQSFWSGCRVVRVPLTQAGHSGVSSKSLAICAGSATLPHIYTIPIPPANKEDTNINTYKEQEKPRCGLISSGQISCCWGSVFFVRTEYQRHEMFRATIPPFGWMPLSCISLCGLRRLNWPWHMHSLSDIWLHSNHIQLINIRSIWCNLEYEWMILDMHDALIGGAIAPWKPVKTKTTWKTCTF